MAVPASLAALLTTPSSNPPSGGENPFPELDDHLRFIYSCTAQLRDQKFATTGGTLTGSTTVQPTVGGAGTYYLRVKNASSGAGVFASLQLQTNALNWEVGTEGSGRFFVYNGTRDCIAIPSTGEVTLYKPNRVDAPTSANELVRKTDLEAAVAAAVSLFSLPVGTIAPIADLTSPAGWLLIDGKTIGSAASGATARANADTATLYAKLWTFDAAAVPIFTSAGAASTRGANAAADFAANKRLALFTPDGGYFLRMWTPSQTLDAGRVAGTTQADSNKAHTHSYTGKRDAGGSPDVRLFGGDGPDDGYFDTDSSGGTEARPYNLAMPHYIKYA